MVSFFWIDQDKGYIFYINRVDNSVYRSDLEGEHFRKVGGFSPIVPPPKRWQLSPDREKLLYFNAHQVGLIFLKPDGELYFPETVFILNYPQENIHEVFWHSDNYHLIVVSETKVSICEARPRSQPLTLVNLNKKSSYSYYDMHTDTLYFIDAQKATDGNYYDNLYKLDMSIKTSPLQDFLKLKPPSEKTGVELHEQKQKN